MRFRRLPLLAVFVAMSSACSSAQRTDSSVPVTNPSIALSTPGDCASIPLPQFNLGGVTYVARQYADTVAEAELGDVLGVQGEDVPPGMLRCEAVQLQQGQGSLERGAHVYAIRGVDQSVAIAAEFDNRFMKLHAP